MPKPRVVKCPLCGSEMYEVVMRDYKPNIMMLHCLACDQNYLHQRSRKGAINGSDQ